jgi:hypothetical protein
MGRSGVWGGVGEVLGLFSLRAGGFARGWSAELVREMCCDRVLDWMGGVCDFAHFTGCKI